MSLPFEATVCEKAQPVVREVGEATAGALDLLHEKVHGFGGSVTVARAVMVDHFGRPALERATETAELGDFGRLALFEHRVEESLGVVGIVDGEHLTKEGVPIC